LEDQVRDVAEEYCPDGYENNEGGYGTLTVYLSLGLAELEHYDRLTDVDAPVPHTARLPHQLQRRLGALGVTDLSATFDGCGDSGGIDEFTVEPDGLKLPDELEDELEDFLLGQLTEGWENNEGGFGTLEVHVASGQVVVDAYWRGVAADAQVLRWKWRR
jgi:hypothetical protein